MQGNTSLGTVKKRLFSSVKNLHPNLLFDYFGAFTYITQPKAQMSDSQPCPCLLRTSGER